MAAGFLQEVTGDTELLIRHGRAVLVVDCQALGMIAVIRSLGRAGYQVHAVSTNSGALGFHSVYCSANACHPEYSSPGFLPWLDKYLHVNQIGAIVPSEGFLHAISNNFENYRPLIPDAVAVEVWQTCLSKVATQLKLLEADLESQHLPPGGIISDTEHSPNAVELGRYTAPFYLKADVNQAVGNGQGVVVRCGDSSTLLEQIAERKSHYHTMLWQCFVPGMQVGVSLWRHCGEILSESMVLGLHTHPDSGWMSLRKTFWHEEILADAKRKLQRLDWQGVAMMEYKWDPDTDEFWFIEINARYWGYLHLDLFAGKDFPRLQLDAHFGHVSSDMGPPRRQFYCRHTVPGEISYLTALLKAPKLPWYSKVAQSIVFVVLFLHPTMKADLLFPADRRLYWRGWLRFMSDLVGIHPK